MARPIPVRCCGLLAVAVAILLAGRMMAAEAEANAKPGLSETGPQPKPVEAPAPKAIDEAIRRGVKFLVESQHRDGSWGSARRTKGLNIYAPVPGAHEAFRAAVTALCISSLCELKPKDRPAALALERGEAWLLKNLPRVRRASADTIYNSWAHAYAIQALVRMFDRLPDDARRQAEIKGLIEEQIELLGRYECVGGGWCYYDFNAHTKKPSGDSNSFLSAAVLVALHEAKQLGVEIPARLIERGTESIRRQRKPDFSYLYSDNFRFYPMSGINRPGGSLGRSQACNLALRLWGDEAVTDRVLTTWLDRLFARNGWLDIGRKRPRPHESWFQVAAYFFYYGHYYAAMCIDQLDPDQRAPQQDQMAHLLLALQEKDGSWWDFPFYDYHQAYGTAYALMSLARCRRQWTDPLGGN